MKKNDSSNIGDLKMTQISSYDFLNQSDPVFRRKIEVFFVSAANILNKYKEYTENTQKEKQIDIEVFLKNNDPIVEMFSKQIGCYENLIYYMKKFIEIK